jgi:hypothetical protein
MFVYFLRSLVRFHKGNPASITEFFATVKFSRAESSALRPTPDLEDQGISLSLVSQLQPVWLGWSYQKLGFRQHSIFHHWDSQTPHPAYAFVRVAIPAGGGVPLNKTCKFYPRLGRSRAGVKLKLYSFFNFGCMWWSAPRSGHFTRFPLYRRLGGPQGCGKSRPYRDSITGPSSP